MSKTLNLTSFILYFYHKESPAKMAANLHSRNQLTVLFMYQKSSPVTPAITSNSLTLLTSQSYLTAYEVISKLASAAEESGRRPHVLAPHFDNFKP